MRKFLAILFLFPLICFGQNKTPLLRPYMQSNGDANGFSWTNAANGPMQDVLTIVSDSRWDVEGVPGWDTWTQVLKQDARFSGKYALIDMARSGDSFAGDLAKIGVFAKVATNPFPASIKKTVLIMLYVNDSGAALDTTKTNALIFFNFWKTNGWRVIAGTDPGPIGTANLVNFNNWLRAGIGTVDYLWDLATNTPLTYVDGLHNDIAFGQLLVTNFIANVLPPTTSGLRPTSLGGQSIQGTLQIDGNPNRDGQGAMALDVNGMIRLRNNTELAFLGNGIYSNTPVNFIRNDAVNTLQFFTFLTKRFEIAQVGWASWNTNVNYGDYPVYVFSKPDTDAFARQIAGMIDQPGGSWKFLFGTNGILHQFKGANVTSAATITPSGYVCHVTAGNTISTINIPYAHFTGSIVLIPDNLWSTSTAGNIALATTAVVNKALTMTYDGTKWYPSY
jgi:hypothetical protein